MAGATRSKRRPGYPSHPDFGIEPLGKLLARFTAACFRSRPRRSWKTTPSHHDPHVMKTDNKTTGGPMMISLNAATVLPDDGTAGTLVGRVWLPSASGPSVVAVRDSGFYDVTSRFPTVSMLAEESD